jgi:hypothetical protein
MSNTAEPGVPAGPDTRTGNRSTRIPSIWKTRGMTGGNDFVRMKIEE